MRAGEHSCRLDNPPVPTRDLDTSFRGEKLRRGASRSIPCCARIHRSRSPARGLTTYPPASRCHSFRATAWHTLRAITRAPGPAPIIRISMGSEVKLDAHTSHPTGCPAPCQRFQGPQRLSVIVSTVMGPYKQQPYGNRFGSSLTPQASNGPRE